MTTDVQSPVNDPAAMHARQRFDRLWQFLAQDPHNPALMADTFDAALAAGAWAEAATLIERGTHALGAHDATQAAAWRFRQATLLLAQRAYDEAQQVLEALAASEGPHPAIAHDLAWIAFCTQDYASCRARLAPWIESPEYTAAPEALVPLHCLWLRTLHRLGAHEDALTWARLQPALSPAAAGVASLIAVDAADFALAQRWSDAALAQPDPSHEALVARATVALSQRDAHTAQRLLDVAMQRHPNDGRTLSALAFLALQTLDLATARQRFEIAVQRLPEHIGTWHGLGWTCLMQQDFTQARSAFETALALDHNFAESHGALAVALVLGSAHTGQMTNALREDASASIERALRLDRSCLSARYAQALLNGEVNDAAAIRRLAERLIGGRVNLDHVLGPKR